jgi:CheY-like chemotaxis protein
MKKALLVDDIRLFLEVEQALLNRPGIRIFTATSGEEAIDIHRKENVDVILLDIHMPGMDGYKVCKLIRSDDKLKDVSIIMVTTSTAAEDIKKCKEAGANDYTVKPINPIELLAKFQKHIHIATREDIRILARVDFEGTKGMESIFGNTINISTSGIMIECTHHLQVGDAVSPSFSLPGNTSSITVTGEVARKAQNIYHGMNRYGIKFLDIRAEDKKVIESFISRYVSRTSAV